MNIEVIKWLFWAVIGGACVLYLLRKSAIYYQKGDSRRAYLVLIALAVAASISIYSFAPIAALALLLALWVIAALIAYMPVIALAIVGKLLSTTANPNAKT